MQAYKQGNRLQWLHLVHIADEVYEDNKRDYGLHDKDGNLSYFTEV